MQPPRIFNDIPLAPTSPPLPDLVEAELDAAALTELIEDVAEYGEVLQVRAKRSSDARADDATLTLDVAHELLRSGHASVQLRYRFDGEIWMDTLIPGRVTTKLVRMRTPER